jgi:peptidoglycan/xylan/chitin deacetylase (PgdA/CDA1 family)
MVARSRWRRERLLILCYHGVALRDEHEWHSELFVTPAFLRRRLQILRDSDYVVLHLAEALARLRAGSLPHRAVCLTFDDGFYNFLPAAAPMLKEFGLPATVYLSTHYAVAQRPLRDLTIRYLLWRGRHAILAADSFLRLDRPLSLGTAADSRLAAERLIEQAAALRSDRGHESAWFGRLAELVGVDWQELTSSRVLHLMTMEEAADLAGRGFDIQLHTHRHRTPRNEKDFKQEIFLNRTLIERHTGKSARHFCYPSGDTSPAFLPWLAEAGIESATTCMVGLANQSHHPLLLPRLVDTMAQSETRFLSWLDGTAAVLTPHLIWRRN